MNIYIYRWVWKLHINVPLFIYVILLHDLYIYFVVWNQLQLIRKEHYQKLKYNLLNINMKIIYILDSVLLVGKTCTANDNFKKCQPLYHNKYIFK